MKLHTSWLVEDLGHYTGWWSMVRRVGPLGPVAPKNNLDRYSIKMTRSTKLIWNKIKFNHMGQKEIVSDKMLKCIKLCNVALLLAPLFLHLNSAQIQEINWNSRVPLRLFLAVVQPWSADVSLLTLDEKCGTWFTSEPLWPLPFLPSSLTPMYLLNVKRPNGSLPAVESPQNGPRRAALTGIDERPGQRL